MMAPRRWARGDKGSLGAGARCWPGPASGPAASQPESAPSRLPGPPEPPHSDSRHCTPLRRPRPAPDRDHAPDRDRPAKRRRPAALDFYWEVLLACGGVFFCFSLPQESPLLMSSTPCWGCGGSGNNNPPGSIHCDVCTFGRNGITSGCFPPGFTSKWKKCHGCRGKGNNNPRGSIHCDVCTFGSEIPGCLPK
jgi:hypothetical protein